MPDVEWVRELASGVRREIHRTIVGLDSAIDALLIALLVQGHVLIEGVPGLAKTYLAKSFASTVSLSFKRIQFTNDLLPSDIVGGVIYDRRTGEFSFRPGPIFANIVLADEINRGAPRTQSALLEAMQEFQVTVEGKTYQLPRPFMVVATQNPIELEGTYPLPEAELDRFLIRVIVNYPSREEELEILRLKDRIGEELDANAVANGEMVLGAIEAAKNVRVDGDVMEYMVDVARETRQLPEVVMGASTRAAVALLYAVKAWAALQGRDYAIPDDVKYVAPMVLNHRIIIRGQALGGSRRVSPDQLIREKVLMRVEAPK
ncbi:MAG: MoxR family ATPase [Candidatus Caldarchaeales archaeon]|jgi:MoxR-like ATPase|nr:MoxR family ATPase [Candidatus Caldarchaeales archaeon]